MLVSCTIVCTVNTSLTSMLLCVLQMLWYTSMLKILSDPIINHTIGRNQVIATLTSEFLVFYHFATKSIQNNQNFKFSADTTQNLGIALLTQTPFVLK